MLMDEKGRCQYGCAQGMDSGAAQGFPLRVRVDSELSSPQRFNPSRTEWGE